MFAIMRTGGKDYRVSKGDIIRVEKLDGKVGDQVSLKDILMVSQEDQIKVGKTQLASAVVMGEIIQQVKGRNVLTYKMKKRKNYRRMKGHRQNYTYLRINDIHLE